MKVSSFVANSVNYNSRLREVLNTLIDLRVQFSGEQPSNEVAAKNPEPSSLSEEMDQIAEIRDTLHSQIECELSAICDAVGSRYSRLASEGTD